MSEESFLVDANAGRLAPWLRALGYDTVFEPRLEDGDLVRLAREERRILLTRDTGIMRRAVIQSGQVRALFILEDDWRSQLRQVVEALGLRREPVFTRCMACNGVLEACEREEAREHVPPYVFRTQESFIRCPDCGRYFWKGTHWARMREGMGRWFRAEEPS